MTSSTAFDVRVFGGIVAVGGMIGAAATPLLKTSWKQNVISGITFGAVFTAGLLGGEAASLDDVPTLLGATAIATVAGIFAASPAIPLKQRAISTTLIGLTTVGGLVTVGWVTAIAHAWLGYLICQKIGDDSLTALWCEKHPCPWL